MHCEEYKRKQAKRFFDSTPEEINGAETPMIPGSVLTKTDSPNDDEEKRAVAKKYPGNYHEYAGAVLFGINGCGPQYMAGMSQLGRFANNPGMEAWAGMNRLMKTWLALLTMGPALVGR